jgi:predicted signal transduction protein with EAL and GGDEF domain
VRETDVAARLGGDEFGILLVGVPDVEYAVDAASRLLTALQEPIEVAGQSITAGASIGIAVDTAQTRGVDDLLGQADIAMYRAKAQGKGRHHVFTGADVLGDQAAVGRVSEATGRAVRRRLSFRKPAVGQAAFGQEPG